MSVLQRLWEKYYSLILWMRKTLLRNKVLREVYYDKTNKTACAPSEDSDQPGHPPSLIRVFRSALNGKLRTQLFFMWTAKTLIRLGRCLADLSLFWGHRSFCWFCHAAAHLSIICFSSIMPFSCNIWDCWEAVHVRVKGHYHKDHGTVEKSGQTV